MTEEGEAGLADGIFAMSEYEAALPTKKSFLAWHRPRKQFVRDYQWLDQVERLLKDEPGLGTLKYLGLPGTDLLDLRFFHGATSASDLDLRFLGFNNELGGGDDAQTELNISVDEVRKLGRVDPRSEIVGDAFERISNHDSIGWKKVRDLGPFDVINLDLCAGFAQSPPDAVSDTLYDAFASLMALQARSDRPWLFLLTTRVGPGHVHDEALAKLLALYVSNLKDCEGFRARSATAIAVSDEASMKTAIATPAGFLGVFLCGLCKWLAAAGLRQAPQVEAEVRSVVGYRVDRGVPVTDLVSLAIRFTPTFGQAPDPSGLATHSPAPIDECATAIQALCRVTQNLVNADDALANDADLNARMIADTRTLLNQARYDTDEYANWVAAGCPV